ncbi:hypothetical protein CcaverHIS002_0204880 [Cutaneotrichosporon cavernicola]|uniref:DASH complex subunit DAD2 n=1 Tax=Cutaneotrichosporon cavernicola TaxID=279322 RepID=A0AA48L1L1_9TREE|nr:uncharacterized protein CcaverHIS019_0204840 [Cutaneotrichosporon cavernicola]BEJ11993.1 hypothetical protein CspHIS471_0204530 [Cutaneotrichosporon sp. HIS471]BEI81328.1 hypothetical protein CcaverHIS002_0204880 [Cutaneotrichosporon cavernicola]BEI89122.1 hypothetical protein CcaverHIS019_0204840 [Cutaneotrichosporon cavernicola]BEI96899.1 hypothetical protein CcaverHIS631_0204880 [Cutaneotrichosporon cavernicola]BEJ04671.1 hypothetical protein CcaverHIS641_0204880 [Cutaneotrichosporon cav
MSNLPPEVANNPTLLKLYHKQQEHSGLQALKEATEGMLAKADKLAEQSNMMADGGEAIGAVLRHWTYVQSILDKMKQYAVTTEDEEPEPLPPMVRLAYTGEGEAQQLAARQQTPRKQ